MIIACDIDGVVCNWTKGFLQYAGYPEQEARTWELWNQLNISEDKFNEIWDGFINDGGIVRLEPMDGAVESISKIRGAGHDIIFITSRKPAAKQQTYQWFLNHGIWYVSIKFCEAKLDMLQQIKPDIYIEDNPYQIQEAIDNGIRIIIYDKPYNRHIKNERVKNWEDIKNIL